MPDPSAIRTWGSFPYRADDSDRVSGHSKRKENVVHFDLGSSTLNRTQLNWIIIRSVFVVVDCNRPVRPAASLPQKATSTQRRYAAGMTVAGRPAGPRVSVCQFVEQSSHQELLRSFVRSSSSSSLTHWNGMI